MKTLALFLLFTLSGHASVLKLEEVISSTRKNFPLILKAKADAEAAREKARSNEGAFDLRLEGEVDNRFEGYYDGNANKFKLVKPLQILNSKIYGGYRTSRGEFPSYEGKNETLGDGEISAGIEFSIWQDSTIDIKRLKYWNSLIDFENAKEKQRLVQMKIEGESIKAYWNWVVAGKILRVQKEMLEIAEARRSGLVKRSKKGDVAAIYVTENDQYIVKRKADVLKAQQYFEQAAYLLSLYLRDKESHPILPLIERVPNELPSLSGLDLKKEESRLNKLIANNPQIKILEQKIEQEKNQLEYGQNLLRPRFDVNLEVNEDRGDGPSRLEQQEVRGMLTVSIPIERNLGKGARESARAKIRGLKEELKYTRELTKVTLDRLIVQLNLAKDIVANAKEEIRLAQIMQKAEQRKFRQGASDFFVINIREQNTADARIKRYDAFMKYQKAYAEYLFLMLALGSEST